MVSWRSQLCYLLLTQSSCLCVSGIGDIELDFKIKITIMNTNKIGAHSSEGLVWETRLGVGSALANALQLLEMGSPLVNHAKTVVTVSPW